MLNLYKPQGLAVFALFFFSFLFIYSSNSFAQGFQSLTNLNSISVSDNTGEKPQSKVWSCAGKWWTVLPNSSGTHIWRLDGTTWTNVLTISTNSGSNADCKVVGDKTYILLYQGTTSELKTVQYSTNTYTLSSTTSITLDTGVETATIDIDGNGRMWLASAGTTTINVRWSDSPYSSWSSPISIGSGVNDDDICAVTAFDGKIGVLWSNQNTQRFGFKYHIDGTDPATWSADEVPASQSALNVGLGMADDHINLAVATDGTIYAAVKTSYDTPGYPRIALLIRRPNGNWDNLYTIDESGTRGIVILNEVAGKVKVVFTASDAGGNILYRESSNSSISFGTVNTLLSGATYNNATSTKDSYSNNILILAANSSNNVSGVIGSDASPSSLVGHWAMEENSPTTVLVDSSNYGNNANITGSFSREIGRRGYSQIFTGTTNYALVPNSSSLNITNTITLAAWIKPNANTTQDVLNKKINGTTNGYELTLSAQTAVVSQKVFVRFNQVTSGDTYRVNSTTTYPTDGTWIHIAATYDGTTIRLYVNGTLENSMAASISIASNTLPLGLGAQSDGTREFSGSVDDARVYNTALTQSEIQALMSTWSPPPSPEPPIENNGAGYALNFDYNNDYVDCGNSASTQITQSITMEAWVKSESLNTQSIIKKNGTGSGYELSLSRDVAGGLPQNFFFRLNAATTYRINSTTYYPIDGTWSHVAATYDYLTKEMKLYVNGIQEGGTLTGPASIVSNSNNLVIGTDAITPRSKYFDGSIDEVRIWNVVRTEAQIRENMCKKLIGTEPGLVGYWNFNEKSGTSIKDLTANGNNGTLMNSDNDEHLFSGAAIGDDAIFDYNSAGGYTATLSSPDGDGITATTTSGSITGLQIYRVEDNPLRTNSTVPVGVTLSPLRYWGVKAIGSGTPTYTVVYNYSGHPGITPANEIMLDLALRDNIADDSWINLVAAVNTTNNTLTLAGMTGTEYTLATLGDDPLPVELSSFTAKMVNQKIILNWSTATEINNYGFEVERKSISDWEIIGFVQGNGNSNSPKNYSFDDENVLQGNLQYRLKQIDNDGKINYSNIVEVVSIPTEYSLYQNYPNPFNPTTSIAFTLVKDNLVSINVYSVLGELVTIVTNKVYPAGLQKVEFNAMNIPSGVYLYQIKVGENGSEFTSVKKMILLK